MRKTLVIPLVLMLTLAGCIQNMSDFKDRVSGAEKEPQESVDDLDKASTTPTTNTTPKIVHQPPVARITIFGSNGALVFKSTFQAEDPGEMVFIEKGAKLSLIASDSEALERGANLTTYDWTLNGKAVEGGRTASVEIPEAGLYTVSLKVADSNNKTDTQTVKLAVAPEPYEVVLELSGGPVVGVEGNGQGADVAFEIPAQEAPANVQSVTVDAMFPLQCDGILRVADGEGAPLGSADSSGHSDLDQTETITLGSVAVGKYVAALSGFACAADAVPVTVTIVFLPIIEGLEAGDGHGHAH